MGVSIDSSEVAELAVDLGMADERVKREADKVMKKSALQVKRRMMEEFSGHRYAGAVPFSLEFRQIGDLAYEVGELDSAGSQWGLAAILSYGTSNNAPVADHKAALRAEAPLIAHYLAEAGQDAVLGDD